MRAFHHRRLPPASALLSGVGPVPEEHGFLSGTLQVWYENDPARTDERAHAHLEADKCFLVLRGAVVVEVGGEEHRIGPREFCFFPVGVFHRIVRVEPPVEAFMIRGPLVDDKVYA